MGEVYRARDTRLGREVFYGAPDGAIMRVALMFDSGPSAMQSLTVMVNWPAILAR